MLILVWGLRSSGSSEWKISENADQIEQTAGKLLVPDPIAWHGVSEINQTHVCFWLWTLETIKNNFPEPFL